MWGIFAFGSDRVAYSHFYALEATARINTNNKHSKIVNISSPRTRKIFRRPPKRLCWPSNWLFFCRSGVTSDWSIIFILHSDWSTNLIESIYQFCKRFTSVWYFVFYLFIHFSKSLSRWMIRLETWIPSKIRISSRWHNWSRTFSLIECRFLFTGTTHGKCTNGRGRFIIESLNYLVRALDKCIQKWTRTP